MIEVTKHPDLGTFAGFSQDHLFSSIQRGEPFIDFYVKEAIDKHVTRDSICVDVGANLGYISVYMAKRCRWLCAVEPQRVVYLQLCANLFLNGCFNVTPLNMAATSHSTTLDFASHQSGWVGTNDFSDYNAIKSIGSISLTESPSGPIRGEPLDAIVQGDVNFIKIDAQGADVDVVLGAERIMREHRPIIVFEYEEDLSTTNYHRRLAELDPLLERVGYIRETIFTDNYLLRPRT